MRLQLTFLLSICFILSACEKDNLIPDIEGSLVGFVYTFDEFANRLPDRGDVEVTAHGLKNYTTYTDQNGRFEFKKLPSGTYELEFSKSGFGTLKHPGIKHLGGMPTTLGLSFSSALNSEAFFLYRIPETIITSLSIDNNLIRATFDFKVDPPERMSLSVIFSDVSGFDRTNAKSSLLCHLTSVDGEFSGNVSFSNLGFVQGQVIYFRASVFNRDTAITDFDDRIVGGIYSYFDYTTYTTVYPALGDESAQFSFIVP